MTIVRKSKIEAKVVADSISEWGVRLTTLQLKYPRFIHSEFMTHRMFSRNASSSRAIPVAKMVEQVRNDPAMPVHWGRNQPGMQAREELVGADLANCQILWQDAAHGAAKIAEAISLHGAHKQIVNRVLEPFQWMHTIVTATDWDNFFALRAHEDAQPEINALAVAMREAMNASKPESVRDGDWHLPYVSKEEAESFSDIRIALQCSAARCARVSYLTHDGKKPSVEEDVKLYQRLVGSSPIHASPTEHQATPSELDSYFANFRGWVQHRRFIESNAI